MLNQSEGYVAPHASTSNEYVKIPSLLLRELKASKVISNTARDLWITLFDLAKFDGNKEVKISMRKLSQITANPERTIQVCLNKLISNSLLVRCSNFSKIGSQQANTYKVMVPKWLEKRINESTRKVFIKPDTPIPTADWRKLYIVKEAPLTLKRGQYVLFENMIYTGNVYNIPNKVILEKYIHSFKSALIKLKIDTTLPESGEQKAVELTPHVFYELITMNGGHTPFSTIEVLNNPSKIEKSESIQHNEANLSPQEPLKQDKIAQGSADVAEALDQANLGCLNTPPANLTTPLNKNLPEEVKYNNCYNSKVDKDSSVDNSIAPPLETNKPDEIVKYYPEMKQPQSLKEVVLRHVLTQPVAFELAINSSLSKAQEFVVKEVVNFWTARRYVSAPKVTFAWIKHMILSSDCVSRGGQDFLYKINCIIKLIRERRFSKPFEKRYEDLAAYKEDQAAGRVDQCEKGPASEASFKKSREATIQNEHVESCNNQIKALQEKIEQDPDNRSVYQAWMEPFRARLQEVLAGNYFNEEVYAM